MSIRERKKIVRPARRPRADEIDVYGITHRGLRRSTNQDHFLIGSLGKQLDVHQTSLAGVSIAPVPEDRHAFFAVVADGVGGTAGGEEASRLAVEGVSLYIAQSTQPIFTAGATDDGALSRALEAAARRCHSEVRDRAGGRSDHTGMATTLTLSLGVWPRVYLLQVGDSRYYVYRDGVLSQVSRDQTIAQDLVDQGVLSAEEAARTRWAHVLSSAIGGQQTAPLVTSMPNDWLTVHLLCSDGLPKHVSDERIAERLGTMTSARAACEELLQDALDGGGSDNITIIVGRAVPHTTDAVQDVSGN
jgi:serine/threonine protein phosphatase PrpC